MADHPHQYALERAAEEMSAADAKCRERIEQLAARSEDGRLWLNTREGFEAMMVGMRHLATAGIDGEANDLIARMAPWCPPPGLNPLAWKSLARRLGMSEDVARTAAGRMEVAKAVVDAGPDATKPSPPKQNKQSYRVMIDDGGQVMVDGRLETVTAVQLRALRILAENRDGIMAGEGNGQLVDADRKSLAKLSNDKPNPWSEVIVFPKGKGKGGYRLL